MRIHNGQKQKNCNKKPRNYKGYCFFYTQIPNVNGPHLIVIITEPVEIQKGNFKSMAVMICSVKNSENFNYDDNCILFVGDIRDKKNKDILNTISYIRYDSSLELEDSEIREMKKKSILQYRCNIPKELLNSIKCGAIDTKELEKTFLKYIDSASFLEDLNLEDHREQNLHKKVILLEIQKQNKLNKDNNKTFLKKDRKAKNKKQNFKRYKNRSKNQKNLSQIYLIKNHFQDQK